MNEQQVTWRVQTTPPSCLSGFRVASTQLSERFDDNTCSIWRIACSCGCDTGRLLGHPLQNLSDGYDGPECFVSPLAFECSKCKTVTELIDTARHGYESEVSLRMGEDTGSSKLRGEGQRRAFSCTGCGCEEFGITVGFVFWYPDELAEEFDSGWEDLFSIFLCYCKCTGCGNTTEPTEFGKL